MTTVKISQLPAITGANTAATDVLPIVDVSGNVTNKITREEFFKNIQSDVEIADKIVHSGDTNTSIRFPAADTVTVETSGTERLRVDSTGNVGIGTASPGKRLDVAGDVVLPNNGILNFYDAGGVARNTLQFLSGELRLGGAGAGITTQTLYTGGSERMRITSAGNVGIGTTTPAAKLEVRNDSAGASVEVARLSNNGAGANTKARLNFFAASTNYGAITGGFGASAPEMTFDIIGASQGNFIWTSASTERMRIDSSGNVGIGTSSPAGLLEVFDVLTVPARNTLTIANKRGLSIYNNQSAGAVDTTLAYGNTVNSYLAFGHHNGTSYAERMRITAAGNVGIGTSSPSQLLHVQSTSGAAGSAVARLSVSGTAGLEVGQEFFSTPTDSASSLRSGRIYSVFDGTSYPAARLSFQSMTTGNVLVDTMHLKAGNVGIGETAPDYKLDVNGAIGFAPGASVTPVDNGDVVFELTNNTTLTIKAKGSDGVVRSATITLA